MQHFYIATSLQPIYWSLSGKLDVSSSWYEPGGGYHCSVDWNVAIVNLVGFVSLSQLYRRQIDVLVTLMYNNSVMVH